MCMTPKMPPMPPVVAPIRYAAEKAPNKAAMDSAGDRMSASVKGAQSTILTSPLGVQTNGQTQMNTLLGA